MNNSTPKLQKCCTQNCLLNHIRTLKQTNFFYSLPSAFPKDEPVKFCLSTAFGVSFTIISVAPIRSSTLYAYFIINGLEKAPCGFPLVKFISKLLKMSWNILSEY